MTLGANVEPTAACLSKAVPNRTEIAIEQARARFPSLDELTLREGQRPKEIVVLRSGCVGTENHLSESAPLSDGHSTPQSDRFAEPSARGRYG